MIPPHHPKTPFHGWVEYFHRPCPYQIKQYTTFPMFPKLPKEIQLMIWKRVGAAYQPLKLTIRRHFREGEEEQDNTWKMDFRKEVPAMRSLCFDSRQEALTRWKPAHAQFARGILYFNFDTDFLEVDFYGFLSLCLKCRLQPDTYYKELLKIKNLMWIPDRYHATIDEHRFLWCCRIFTNLDRFFVYEEDWDLKRPHTGLPHVFGPNERSFRHDWSLIRPIVLSPVPNVRGPITEWNPPQLIMGTKAQWKRLGEIKDWSQQGVLGEGKKGWSGDEMEWELTLTVPSLEYSPLYGRSG